MPVVRRQAEEAARLYTSLIPDSRIDRVNQLRGRQPEHGQGRRPDGRLHPRRPRLVALNGGPDFPFTEATSLSVLCEDQAEVDRLWTSLILGGGEPGRAAG